MPIINVTLGPLEKEQKKKLIKELTEVSMRITGAPESAHTVAVNELPLDALGLGTKTVEEIVNKK